MKNVHNPLSSNQSSSIKEIKKKKLLNGGLNEREKIITINLISFSHINSTYFNFNEIDGRFVHFLKLSSIKLITLIYF